MNNWVRWTLVFTLVSIGSALLDGLSYATRDSSPIGFLLGFWFSRAADMLAPGLIIGGILSLILYKSKGGLIVMIVINTLMSLSILLPQFISLYFG